MSRGNLQRWLMPITIASVLAIVFGALVSSSPGRQLRVIRQIRNAGGAVYVTPPNGAGWLGAIQRSLPDAFGEVQSLSLADVPVRQNWLYAIRDWKRLDSIWLNRSGVTDADMTLLADHRELYSLYLNGNSITDQGLRNLGLMPSLRYLEVNWTQVSKLDTLNSQFGNLGILKLRGAPINDASLTEISRHRHVFEVDLSRTAITDAGLRKLSKSTSLLAINLTHSRTTAKGAQNLQSEHLNWLIYDRNGKTLDRQVE